MLGVPTPKQIIRVKRKKVDEPVDLLYVENEHRDRKRRVTECALVFRRLCPEATAATGAQLPHQGHPRFASSQFDARVPIVRATAPGEENLPQHGQPTVHSNGALQAQAAPTKPSQRATDQAAGPDRSPNGKYAVFPRRFHLSKVVSTALPDRPAHTLRDRKADSSWGGPVLVEKRTRYGKGSRARMESARERTERSCDPQRNSRDLDTNMAEAPLKRPGASKAERMWRSKHWNQRRPVSAQDNRDEETVSPQLIAELQKYAEEIENQAEQQGVDQRRLSTESKQKPNVPPNKLPSPHGNDPSHNSDSDDMDLACKEESEFVYDTYVSFHTSSLATSGSGREVPNGNFGFIVIEEEDQPIWEAFMCEEEAAKEWNTDDEDENAEDYYGADYPEDELASGDERDVEAYKYRVRPSDEEEFDSDTPAWSDEETDLRYPWKRHPWQNTGRDAKSSDSEADEEEEVL